MANKLLLLKTGWTKTEGKMLGENIVVSNLDVFSVKTGNFMSKRLVIKSF